MQVFERFSEASLVHDLNVIWRCVAIDPKPEEISSLLTDKNAQSATKRTLERIVAQRGTTRSRLIWRTRDFITRYSDGSVPVVYFSQDPETSITECCHWAYRDMERPSSSTTFSLLVYSVEFSGALVDFSDFTPPCNELVHDTDYTCCNDLAKKVTENTAVDGLIARSARRLEGVNTPLFQGTSVGEILREIECKVTEFNERRLVDWNSEQIDVSSIDVFAGI